MPENAPYMKAWEWRKPYPPDRRRSMFDRRFPGGVLVVTGWRRVQIEPADALAEIDRLRELLSDVSHHAQFIPPAIADRIDAEFARWANVASSEERR